MSNPLDALVGDWKVTGEQLESDIGRAAKVDATEHFEWVQGNHYLTLRFTGRLGDAPMDCIEVYGPGQSERELETHAFYNDGHQTKWAVRLLDDGTWQYHDQTPGKHVRCLMTWSKDRQSRSGRWESSKDGQTWQPFWLVSATRA